MSWVDFIFGVSMGALVMCGLIVMVGCIVASIVDAWNRLKARVKALEDAAPKEELE